MNAPALEPRRADAFEALLRERLPAYVPGWEPPPGGPADALLAIYARFLGALGERIDRTPDKALLAFLDLLGLELLPAQAARAPVVLDALPQLGDGQAPAGTRLAATDPANPEPIVFETETAIALAAAQIAEVVTVWPGRDAYADHSADAIGGRPFTLWEPLAPIAHELYVAHDLHLALAGQASVRLDVRLATAGSGRLRVRWQHWDGELWRDFAAPRPGDDTTAGLSRSGAVLVRSDCATSEARAVEGVTSHWLRGVLADPLPPDDTRVLPQVDALSLRTVLDRDVGDSGAAGLLPDAAFAGGARLDPTKAFQPFGAAPSPDVGFYVSCSEAFSRPGAQVTIGLSRPYTEQEKTDIRLARYEVGVNEARSRLDQLKATAATLDALLAALVADELRADNTPLFAQDQPEKWYRETRQKIQTALDEIRRMAGPAQSNAASIVSLTGLVPALSAAGPLAGPAILAAHVAVAVAAVAEAQIVASLGIAANALSSGNTTLKAHVDALTGALTNANTELNNLANGDLGALLRLLGATGTLVSSWLTVAADLDDWPASIFLDPALPSIFTDARATYAEMRRRIDSARAKLRNVTTDLLDQLDDLAPEVAAAAAGVVKPKFQQPHLQWQYWNGSRWRPLHVESVDRDGRVVDGPRHLRHGAGRVRFTAPADWRPSTYNDTEGHWLRVLIRNGAFAIVKTVSWFDQQTKSIQYMAISDPRPPLLDVFSIGYHWESAPAAPQACLTRNDFAWADHTTAAARPGEAFAPFSPTGDRTPALYLGFDRPLPAGQVGLFAQIAEVAGQVAGPPLDWEAWDGATWQRILVADETNALALPGALRVQWPGFTPPAAVPVVAAPAGASAVRLVDGRSAAAFASGDVVWLAKGDAGEAATVDAAVGDTLALRTPLGAAYDGGALAHAGLMRFGRPRTWLRARLRVDGDPRPARVDGLHRNAVWAAQVQTVRDELLGSSTGEPRQSLRFTRAPVLPGERIEVRELDGPRAAVELPLLLDELVAAGVARDDVRVVADPRTDEVREVWVPWHEQPNLLRSRPGDRHYTIERSGGRLIFGDGVHGRIPPAGANAVRARMYRSGGGPAGNVPTGAIAQALSGIVVQGVANPIAADGGAAGEPQQAILARGPLSLRHRRQALSVADYEALAREASPAVALARALPATRPGGRAAPGWVTLIVAPRSAEDEPQPSFALRRQVRDFLAARAPAAVAGRLAVVGPAYRRVGVSVAVAPRVAGDAGTVVEAVRVALADFLHPLTGGPDAAGWAARTQVCLSDVAAVVASVAGVDHAEQLRLVDRGVPVGDVLAVGRDRLVAAGPIRVLVAGS